MSVLEPREGSLLFNVVCCSTGCSYWKAERPQPGDNELIWVNVSRHWQLCHCRPRILHN